MKKVNRITDLLLAAVTVSTIIGCHTFDPSIMRPSENELNTKLLRLTLNNSRDEIKFADINSLPVNSLYYTVFERELDNIMEQSGDYFGAIELVIIYEDLSIGYFWSILSGLTFMIPNIFGMPIGSGSAYLENEFIIYDKEGEVIWKKSYYGKIEKAYSIYSYEARFATSEDAYKEIMITLLKENIEKFKHDLEDDIIKINSTLSENAN